MGEEKAPTLPDLLWGLARTILRREALMTLASVAVLMAAGGGGVIYAQTKGRDAIDAGVLEQLAPVKAEQAQLGHQVKALDARLERMERATVAKEQRDAERFDTLYRVILSGQPSRKAEELARPAASDGGP